MPGTTTARATATGRTGRRGCKRRWLLRLGVLAVLVGWLALAGAGGPMVGRLAEVQENDNANFLPENAESTRVNELASQFVDATALPYFGGARAGRRHHRAGPGDGGRVRGMRCRAGELSPDKKVGDYLTSPVTTVPSRTARPCC